MLLKIKLNFQFRPLIKKKCKTFVEHKKYLPMRSIKSYPPGFLSFFLPFLSKIALFTRLNLPIVVKVIRSRNKLPSCNFSQKTNETHSGYYPEYVSLVFWEKLRLANFVLRLIDLLSALFFERMTKLKLRFEP